MTPQLPEGKRRISPLRLLFGAVGLLVLGAVWALFLVGTMKSYRVVSESMAPTLLKSDFVLMRAETEVPQLHGRVVVFPNPKAPDERLTKRVVADGGATVEVRSGVVLVNGKPETVRHERLRSVRDRRWTLNADEVFVLGDNRNDSFDSIDYGPVLRSTIHGVVVFRYWPISRMGTVN